MKMKCLFAFMVVAMLSSCNNSQEYSTVTGPQGPQGSQGDVGPAGSNGHSLVSQYSTPDSLICPNGGSELDIYMDTDDSLTVSEGDTYQNSLIACNGSNGLDGSNGADGLPGVQGPQGNPGDPGATGPQGIAGAAGPQGVAGPAGTIGATGATGAQGPTGPAGPQGPQGTTGATGPTGSGATVQSYTLTGSCQSIGSGMYAISSSNNAKIYSSNHCSGNSLYTVDGGQSIWLSSTELATVDNTSGTVLRVLNFN